MRGNTILINAFEYAKELDSKKNINRPITLTNAFNYFVNSNTINITNIQQFKGIKNYENTIVENISIELDKNLLDKVKMKLQSYFPDTRLQYPFICRIALTSYIMSMLNDEKQPTNTNYELPQRNRNQNIKWALNNGILIDNEIINDADLRGIYGIFVQDECVYVGRASSFYSRFFMGDCHILRIRNCNHVPKLIDGYKQSKRIEIKILEKVSDLGEHPAKEAQRLASRECYWIDFYQAKDQCLEQYPEGRWN